MMTMMSPNPHRQHRRSRRRQKKPISSTESMTPNNGNNNNNNNNKIIVIGLVAFCLINILDVDNMLLNRISSGPPGSSSTGRRRSLLSTLYLAGSSTLLPWAQHHMVDVTDRPDPVSETALFWRKLLFLRWYNILLVQSSIYTFFLSLLSFHLPRSSISLKKHHKSIGNFFLLAHYQTFPNQAERPQNVSINVWGKPLPIAWVPIPSMDTINPTRLLFSSHTVERIGKSWMSIRLSDRGYFVRRNWA